MRDAICFFFLIFIKFAANDIALGNFRKV